MLTPETVLQGRYRIIRQLGQGGMGAVYEAVDERLDTVVALKETLFTDEKLRKQFEREARLLARLHHQALPRVSDHFNEADGQFLVMQYIAGEDFFEMLAQRHSPFSQAEVLGWGDQLCDTLDYLHTQDPQIIHRDIKPQNLKLTARGQVVLLDFGLAKGSAGQMSVVTTSASIYGYTPNYAPLEQVQGLGTDPRSDIYSLSATLFHLLTSIKPPDALSRAAAIVNGLPDPLPGANEVASNVSSAVAAVLSKGMSQKRDDRYESAELMREALRAAGEHPAGDAATVLIAGANADSSAHTLANRPPTNLPDHQTRPMESEAQTLIAADATSVRPVTGDEAATAVRPTPGPTKRPFGWLAAAVLLVLVGGSVGAFYLYRARQNPATPSSDPAASKPTEPVTSVPVDEQGKEPTTQTTEPKTDKGKAETATQRAVTSKQTTEKNPEPSKPTTTQTSTSDSSAHESSRDPNRNPGSPPEVPSNDPVRNPPGVNRPPGPNKPGVRVYPGGMKIVTQPDGTRVVTMPNGTTRVIPPGEPNRRRRP